ncbi:hypothetical protein KI387_034478, partial [Taxus chinensis]
ENASAGMGRRMKYLDAWNALICLTVLMLGRGVECALKEAFRRDPGHPQWHHGAFQDVSDLKSDIRHMLHSSSAAQTCMAAECLAKIEKNVRLDELRSEIVNICKIATGRLCAVSR